MHLETEELKRTLFVNSDFASLSARQFRKRRRYLNIQSLGAAKAVLDLEPMPRTFDFSADGRVLVLLTNAPDAIQLHDVRSGKLVHSIQEFEWEGKSESMLLPQDMCVDVQSGNLVVADTFNHRVLVLSPLGRPLMKLGGPPGHVDGLQTPMGVALDGRTMLVADRDHCRLVRFSLHSGKMIASVPLFDENGAPVHPCNVAALPGGRYAVADWRRQVRVWGPEGGRGSTPLGQTAAGSTFGWTHFAASVGLDSDAAGRVLVADAALRSVRVFTADGSTLTQLTAATAHPGWLPQRVRVTADGGLAVLDGARRQLLRF